jgi:hypothetical protein
MSRSTEVASFVIHVFFISILLKQNGFPVNCFRPVLSPVGLNHSPAFAGANAEIKSYEKPSCFIVSHKLNSQVYMRRFLQRLPKKGDTA